MTPNDNLYKTAAERYNGNFSNVTYTAIQRAVIIDIYGSIDMPEWDHKFEERLGHEIPNRLMNTIIDAASEICDWPGFEGGLYRLTNEAVINQLSDNTLNLIVEHLKRFQNIEDTAAEDFRATVKALRCIKTGKPILMDAVGAASDIHDWQGRAAHNLLTAAHFFVEAANLLLHHHHDGVYIREKLQKGLNRFNNATEEGFRHSGNPSNYEFSEKSLKNEGL